jgi:hypothetical protein
MNETQLSQPKTVDECIGLTAHYRKPHETEMTCSQIKSLRSYVNLSGKSMNIFTMANGDRIDPGACYFERSTAPASS